MASPPRIFENGSYYHVYNRGNRKQQIFFHHRDYERFTKKILEYKKKYSVEILAYCLMPNHFHFILQQQTSNSISKFISDLCNSYCRYFNVKHELIGSIFQGRFKSKKVESDEYLVHLSRYIHLNPVELFGMIGENTLDQLLEYKWSSLPTYLTGRNDELVSVESILSYFSSKDRIEDYKNFVASQVRTRVDPIIEGLTFED